MKIGFILVFAVIVLLIGGFYMQRNKTMPDTDLDPNSIRFVAVGDSYTEGLGVQQNETWPMLLVDHLQKEGIEIELVKNLAITGYTAEDVITYELPEYDRLQPQFATLLIGANDVSLGISEGEFRSNLIAIIDRMQGKLKIKQNLILLTIPDFTMTPGGKDRFDSELYKKPLKAFNQIIREEAGKRNLQIVDLEKIYEEISMDQAYFTEDGLHPSGKQYIIWERKIYPFVYSTLRKK